MNLDALILARFIFRVPSSVSEDLWYILDNQETMPPQAVRLAEYFNSLPKDILDTCNKVLWNEVT